MSDSPRTDSTDATGIVRVRLFSVLRENVGRRETEVEVDGPITGGELLDRLGERHPILSKYRPVIRLAVRERYASEADPVHPGDEVALITPVSGG